MTEAPMPQPPMSYSSQQPNPPEMGLVQGLADLRFTGFITPTIVRVIYIVGLIGIVLFAVGTWFTAFAAPFMSGFERLLTFVGAPIGASFAALVLRMLCEQALVFFRIAEHLREIDRKTR